jgi:ATP-dependent RNA helicase MRH4
VSELLGPGARPTPIQALALKHLLGPGAPPHALLAAETGSGKSLAYLLPMLQALKAAEPAFTPAPSARALNPRALVLAPTHELARQLAGVAKALSHVDKARVLCASRANGASTGGGRGGTAAQMAKLTADTADGEFAVHHQARDVDVLVATPNKALEMVRGRGWQGPPKHDDGEAVDPALARKEWTVGRPEMGLANVEWVVVDEADVLFGRSLPPRGRAVR